MKEYIIRDGYLITIGTKQYFARLVTSIRDRFGFRNEYELRAVYKALKRNRFWARKDGTLTIHAIDWIDYIPQKKKDHGA